MPNLDELATRYEETRRILDSQNERAAAANKRADRAFVRALNAFTDAIDEASPGCRACVANGRLYVVVGGYDEVDCTFATIPVGEVVGLADAAKIA